MIAQNFKLLEHDKFNHLIIYLTDNDILAYLSYDDLSSTFTALACGLWVKSIIELHLFNRKIKKNHIRCTHILNVCD